jgi:hypothetical protein
MLTKLAILTILLSACSTDPGSYFEEVPDEADLSAAEQAELPDGFEAEHHDELALALAAEHAEDDAMLFDDDEVEAIVDVEVDVAAAPAPLLAWGLHPRASDGLRSAGVASWRITQTIGNAAASAGTHARDGYVNGQPYSAATDLSTSGMSITQVHNLLERLAKLGFVCWYRQTGRDGWNGVTHMHIVYANAAMKSSLRSQVRSWLAGRNGLVSNTLYQFHHFSSTAKAQVKAKFTMSQQGTSNGGAGVSGRVNTAGAALTIRSSASTNGNAIGSLSDGAYFAITCQKRGQSVHGTYGSSTLWDKVQGGYVADAYVATGSDGQVAPTCP